MYTVGPKGSLKHYYLCPLVDDDDAGSARAGGQAHSAGGSGQEDNPPGESQYAYSVRFDESIPGNRKCQALCKSGPFRRMFINS